MAATPSLVLDRTILQRNIDRMVARVAAAGCALRPHVKTHKCLEIARLQRDAGAQGITVATIGEAEVFADGGFDDIFIAYPVWVDAERGARLTALRERAQVTVGLDSVEGAAALAAHAPGARALVEVDPGHHRSGVAPSAAGDVAARAAALGLDVAGVFTFPGHSYAPDARPKVAADETTALAEAAESLRGAGVEPRVISGGSSPSVEFAQPGVLTELRPGAYIFNDAQQWELGACGPQDIALTVHATVVSHAGGRLVLDSGSKALAADKAPWATGNGRLLDHPDARIVILSEHHAVCELPGELPPLGSIVRVVPNHCCNAVALADSYVVRAADSAPDGSQAAGSAESLAPSAPEQTWAVAARGRNA